MVFFGEKMENLRNYFDRHASSWDEMLKYEDKISELSEVVNWFKLAEGHSVLDIGTGTGILLPLLREAISMEGKVIAIDFSFKMLERARPRQCLGEKVLINANAESLPFQSDLFDRIICFSAFPHFHNKAKALLEMVRVLKGGGTLFITHLKSVEELNQFHRQLGGPVAHDFLPHPERIKELMKDAGLFKISIINQPGKFLAQGRKI
jgi:ubiquinone/menaquinone biosynthesis C-methylase UbiE